MSGIFGIWNFDGKPVERTQLELMSAELAHRGDDGAYFWMEAGVGFGCQLRRTTPSVASEVQPVARDGVTVLFDGRLDDRDELIQQLNEDARVSAASSDPELVAAAYLKWGEQFCPYLKGDFAIALFDARVRKLFLVRDAIGARPLYYSITGNTLIFATEIKAILQHPDAVRVPNDEEVGAYLIGVWGTDRGATLFKDIHAVIPSHLTTVTAGPVSTRKYWDFDTHARLRLNSFDEYAERFRFHFERSIRRRLAQAQPVAVFVSGGVDSSSVLSVAERLRRSSAVPAPGIVPITFTTPEGTQSDERAFLSVLERDYGIEILRIDHGPVTSLEAAFQSARDTEIPGLDSAAGLNRRMLKALRDRGVRTVVSGHWSDQVLFNESYLLDLIYRFRFAKARQYAATFSKWFTETPADWFGRNLPRVIANDMMAITAPRVLWPLIARKRAERVTKQRAAIWATTKFREAATRGSSRYDHFWTNYKSASARALYKNLRSSSWVMTMEYNNKWIGKGGIDASSPFLDRDLLEFLMQVPGEIHLWDGVPKALLRRAMHGILPPEIENRKWKADFRPIEEESLRRNSKQMFEVLEGDTRSSHFGFVDAAKLRQHVDSIRRQLPTDPQAAWSLEPVVALEIWLRTFFA